MAAVGSVMIDTAELNNLFKFCLYGDSDADGVPDDAVVVAGITATFGLHPRRVQECREKIAAMLAEMCDEFFVEKGGGWSFLNLCVDRNGNHWGEHQSMQELCVLAIAAGLGKWLAPREMWLLFPGGMPYIGFVGAEAQP